MNKVASAPTGSSIIEHKEHKFPHDSYLKWAIDTLAVIGFSTYEINMVREQIKNAGGSCSPQPMSFKALASLVATNIASGFLWGGIAGSLYHPSERATRTVLGKDATNTQVTTGAGMLSSAGATVLMRPVAVITVNSQTQGVSATQSAKDLLGHQPLQTLKLCYTSPGVGAQVLSGAIFGGVFWGGSSFIYHHMMHAVKNSESGSKLSEKQQKLLCGTTAVATAGTGAIAASTPFSLYAREKAYETSIKMRETTPQENAVEAIVKPLGTRAIEAFKGNLKRFIVPLAVYGAAATLWEKKVHSESSDDKVNSLHSRTSTHLTDEVADDRPSVELPSGNRLVFEEDGPAYVRGTSEKPDEAQEPDPDMEAQGTQPDLDEDFRNLGYGV